MFHRSMGFAGSWYPTRAQACTQQIEAFWKQPDPSAADQYVQQGARQGSWLGVVPHAGWVFSGRLAAQVFRALEGGEDVELVIVLGGHLGPGDPVVAMCEGEWETPLGPFTIHSGFTEQLQSLSQVVLETEKRNHPDNSTELQLPFAKYKYPRAQLLPIRVPPAPAAQKLGRMLAEYVAASGLRTVAVASTDLTHYGPNYGFEPKGSGAEGLRWVNEVNDPAFIRALEGRVEAGVKDGAEGGDGEAILAMAANRHNACSAGAVVAVNEMARAAGQRFSAIGHTTSAEAALGDTRNFVGYLGGLYS